MESILRGKMPRTEQASQILLSRKNPFDLILVDENGKHSLAVEEPRTFGQGASEESQDLMRTMMTAHLLGPTMPEKVATNFDLRFPELLEALYEYYGKKKPRILRLQDQVKPEVRDPELTAKKIKTATSHSGGLDSVYRIARLMEQKESILAAHIRNLNAKGNYQEALASEAQCKAWGVPYVSVRLRNGSGSTGFDTMRTRDLLLALMVGIQAAPHQARKVLIEGDMGTDKNYHFSENANVLVWFNKLLKETGLDIEVVGMDPGDIETIGEIIELEKQLKISILPMVQNCFSATFQRPNNRRKWERETPVIARSSSEHWCGSCLKCRRMTLGRLIYEDPRFAEVTKKEVEYFIRDTYDWMKKYPHSGDLISKNFLEHLVELARKWY